MRFVVAALGLAVVGIVGWMLIDLRSSSVRPVENKPIAAAPAPAPAPAPPSLPPARPLPIAAPPSTPAPQAAAPEPSPRPESPEAEDPVASANPLDVVKMGKTIREWRHYYGERQRAIQQDLYKYQDILDRENDVQSEQPSEAQLAEAKAHIKELTDRMKDDLVELKKIESSP